MIASDVRETLHLQADSPRAHLWELLKAHSRGQPPPWTFDELTTQQAIQEMINEQDTPGNKQDL